MSKWTWIEQLPRNELEDLILRNAEAETNLRLQVLDTAELQKQLKFRLNRLRREAGEIP